MHCLQGCSARLTPPSGATMRASLALPMEKPSVMSVDLGKTCNQYHANRSASWFSHQWIFRVWSRVLKDPACLKHTLSISYLPSTKPHKQFPPKRNYCLSVFAIDLVFILESSNLINLHAFSCLTFEQYISSWEKGRSIEISNLERNAKIP